MGRFYAWASPEYLLDNMSFEQITLYYNRGWEAQRAEASVYWGILGQALSGDEIDPRKARENFRKNHPEGGADPDTGAWKTSV